LARGNGIQVDNYVSKKLSAETFIHILVITACYPTLSQNASRFIGTREASIWVTVKAKRSAVTFEFQSFGLC